MAMLIYMSHTNRRGREFGGWLILEHGEANAFHVDDGTLTEKEIQQRYGGISKGRFSVTGQEWRRYLSKVGVQQVYEEPQD